MERPRLAIVGGGMAAARLLEELDARAPGRFRTTVLSREPWTPYNRILLSSVLAGEKTLDDIALIGPGWLAARGIDYRAGTAVAAIDRAARTLRTERGEEVPYDVLVLATGSHPLVPPLPGGTLAGVATFRDIADIARMSDRAVPGGRAVVIGGGLLGLEAAVGLGRRGMAVTVLHLMSHVMERQLDGEAAGLLCAELGRRGISVLLEAQTEALLGEECVRAVRLRDGRELPADLVVIAIGVRPNAELARAAGLAVNRGMVVDDALATADPAIFGLGECVEHRGQTFGLVAPIQEQAAILARRLAGDAAAAYAGTVCGTALKVSGVEVYSAGDHLGGADCESIVLRDPASRLYRRLVLREGRLAGAVLVGDSRDGGWYFDLIRSGASIDALRAGLVFGRRIAEGAPAA